MSFYSMTEPEVDDLEADRAETLLGAAKILDARAALRAIEISLLPKTSREDQIKTHKRFYAEAYPERMEIVRPISPQELKGMGFG